MAAVPPPGEPDATEEALEPGYRLSFILDPDGLVRRVAEASGVRDWPQEGFVGRTLSDISAERAGPERGDLWDARVERAQRAHKPELYLDRVPGAPVDAAETVSSTFIPVRTAGGELQAIVVELEDRAKVGPREAQVRASERRFRELAESLPQIVWESDGAGNARYLSPKWEAFSGRPVRELLGRGYVDLIHPDDRAAVAAAREAASNGVLTVDFRLRRHDGEYRWMQAHVELIRDERGFPIKGFGAAIDVTERRLEEEARMRSQKREMVGTLLGGIAHDFNNVLGAILSNAALARREVAAGQDAGLSLTEIERGAARAADLVRRVLAQGRDDGDTREVVDVGAVAQEAADLLRSGLPATARLRVRVDDDVPALAGDATQIHQVVVNLVRNAAQALGDVPGTIDVHVESGEHPDCEARRVAVLRVRDNGPGMPEDVRRRVFDPYFTTKPPGEGSGLGLSAVRTVVRSYDGTVEVESSPGAGATFTVSFPAAAAADAADDPAVGTTPLAVMFVDDEPALVQLAERALPADGLSPVGFTDPQDALTAFTAEPRRWVALVTDLSMPGLDGLTLAERMRSTRPDLPVVLTSGYLQQADRDRARELGVDAIIPKPCSMSDLASAVHTAAA